ncbi:phosphoribosylglycinamide synthetase C domain-containing protein [Bdellovibrio sp. HCB288]|uniref:phosphoribosylglycinamide synthetase C domain-containing protein n=1 Tax=Bdellovibrio sp. HCB288 TaxID=3394355 RepID=UPI0039B4170C
MKFLFVTRWSSLHALASQIIKEGHEVKYTVLSKTEKEVGDGFVDKIENWEEYKSWADAIIFDDSDFGDICEKLRKEGHKVVGGTKYSDRLEFDREFGSEEMKAAGLTKIPSWEFQDFDSAIQFIKDNPGRYVVKPSGKAQNDKVLSYVGQEEDGKDVVTILERYRKGWGRKIRSFQIQKFVSGVEVAVGAFFNGRKFILPALINFEHKKLMNGDIGPATGEMGTTGFWASDTKIFRETLAKMESRIQGYVGYFDINCIVNARGVYPLEFTPRFGYPTLNLQLEGILSKWGEFMYALAAGQDFQLRTKKGLQLAVVVAVPPFPFSDNDTFRKFSEDAPVVFKKPIADGVYPCEVKKVDGEWLLTGTSGYSLVVSGAGSTMDEARKEAYGKIKNIQIPNMFYRTDIGERWHRDSDLLQTWGLLT